ncbi:unnamed protein product [Ectocarpus fasciculatus]
MTEGEQEEAIRHRDAVRARAPAGAGTPGPCSAGDNCVAKDGDQAITTQCKHGNGRHFLCSRVACSPDCGEGGGEGGGDPKTPGGSDAGPDALTLDDSESRARQTPTAVVAPVPRRHSSKARFAHAWLQGERNRLPAKGRSALGSGWS